MLKFQAPELTDKAWVDRLLAQGDSRGCEYNFTNLYTWKGAYRHAFARLGEELLLVRAEGVLGRCYLCPIGGGDLREGISALLEEERAGGETLRLVCLTAEQRAAVEALFPGKFRYEADRDGFDYLYDIDRLADLGGKKLHGKRNHISRFMENCPDWRYEELTPDALEECLEMDREWYRRSRVREGAEEEEDLGNEGVALRLAMEHYELLGLEGGLIRVEGKVVAFTMGDGLSSDTYDVHFEKAYAEIQGAYAIINREFARQVRERHPEVRYLNREDDMGVEGLRKAKESYYPDRMVEKYAAIWQG